MMKVLLIEDNRIEAKQTQHWLNTATERAFEVECAEQLKQGLERLAIGGIDIILLDLNLPDSRGIETFVTLHNRFPEVPIVVLTGEYDDAIGPTAVEKGAQDYLVKQNADSTSLTRVLRYAFARHRAQADRMKQAQFGKSARVIGFVGAKGGVGTTTTALNVATALAMQGKSVILVELRPSFGTLRCHLHLTPVKSLRSLLDLTAERIGNSELNAVLTKGPAGMWIAFGPNEDEEFKEIEPSQVESIIKGLSRMAEFVILDLPSQPSTASQAAVNLCDFVAVVVEREPGAVIAGQVVVKQLFLSGVNGSLARRVVPVGAIIVTRTIFPNYSMDSNELRSQLDCQIVGIIPRGALENLRALTEGVPLVLLEPDNDTSESLTEIANRVATEKVAGINV